MNDSGNFMLLDGDKNPIWETFKEPTDTILPGQTLNMGSNLTARYSRESYADGRFQLLLQTDGNLVLYTVTMPTGAVRTSYWATMTVTGNFDAGSSQDIYHMARIDYDGVFRQYHCPESKTRGLQWSVVKRFPEDICSAIQTEVGSGACGFNSICVEKNGEPDCSCPQNYSYLNEIDKNQGCRPNFELPSCRPNGWESNVELVEFAEYTDTDWPLDDYDLQIGSGVDLQTCQQLCLNDCFCTLAVHNGNSCWKKKYPLSNGRRMPNVNRTALLKVPKVNVTQLYLVSQRQNIKDQSTTVLIVSILLGSSVFINIVMTLAICIAIYFSYHNKLLNISSVSNVASTNIRSYAYKELEQATGGFKQILGKGAFGTVYKGVLASYPKRFVAIKKLEKFEQEGEKEFKTEVSVIGQTHHKNLVCLLGYCDEGEHRLLVYEYMTNGSLASLLFGITRPDWNQRVQIAFGIARGLMYLHEECSTQIIHCDIKPQNILLDEFYTPRISDFGLAKLLLAEQTRVARTNIRGTVGYFAPEWFSRASITVKVDVYSFGVLLLETICCKSSVAFGMGDQEEALMDWVYACYCKKKMDKLVENDEDARNDMKKLERLVMVAIWCIQEDASLRPSMKKVTQMLEGVVDVSVPPRPSIYFST
ncbi:G-type lectin S-receptor-like serine/threonine-protein kinase LECRK3 [Populus alba x Populus x berolinensis]|nr:G-type lectin S-receptor-like serine/threonine-protein kinase LECRK3 [Populus alba x Populus x berolinensis]